MSILRNARRTRTWTHARCASRTCMHAVRARHTDENHRSAACVSDRVRVATRIAAVARMHNDITDPSTDSLRLLIQFPACTRARVIRIGDPRCARSLAIFDTSLRERRSGEALERMNVWIFVWRGEKRAMLDDEIQHRQGHFRSKKLIKSRDSIFHVHTGK